MVLSDQESSSSEFLDAHPELRTLMKESKLFFELKKRKALSVDEDDEEQLYIVRGDTLGDEDELYVDALVRGSNPEGSDELSHKLFLELDEKNRSLIMERRQDRKPDQGAINTS
jgi:hypothetical protein